jgi:hypothetical protein
MSLTITIYLVPSYQLSFKIDQPWPISPTSYQLSPKWFKIDQPCSIIICWISNQLQLIRELQIKHI